MMTMGWILLIAGSGFLAAARWLPVPCAMAPLRATVCLGLGGLCACIGVLFLLRP
jgi:hypothetical protein